VPVGETLNSEFSVGVLESFNEVGFKSEATIVEKAN
jgi:hypothetical protein